jgi:hypothetical protein
MSVIKTILQEKGWDIDTMNRLKPSDETLAKLGISTINQWNKILNGEIELTLSQAESLSKWLEIPFDRLLQKTIADKS